MSHVATNQPEGTPTWIDLGIPDLDRAMALLRGALRLGVRRRAGRDRALHDVSAARPARRRADAEPRTRTPTEFWWNVYLAADDCDATVERVRARRRRRC